MHATLTEEQAYDAITAAGATRAIISFSGGNDEGGADAVTLTKPDENGVHEIVLELEPHVQNGGQDALNKLTEYLEDLPSSQYGSFAGEFYVDGTIVVDALSRKTSWSVEEETIEEYDD